MPNKKNNLGGPRIVRVTGRSVYDLTATFPTISDLINQDNPQEVSDFVTSAKPIASFEEIAINTLADRRDDHLPFFISPIDLQPVKACGVTFFDSLVERMIEERTGGNKDNTSLIRAELVGKIGVDLNTVKPGSRQALELLTLLKQANLWSQYLEVGLGVDAEVFTKALPLASVGTGAEIGILRSSNWNNPEPEVTVIINHRGDVVGTTLGNDVNHRDIEGRSALLLGRAKDNNAGCALGPFIRLLDKSFTLDDVRGLDVYFEVEGQDGKIIRDQNTMNNIRRDVTDLVGQCIGPSNSYPDGVALLLGAMSSFNYDRDKEGSGFTHKIGDIVRISSPQLGLLVNRVQYTDNIKVRNYGINALMKDLAQRSCM
jgi:fumarylacetoacetate (FAA) hydrolase family protein